MRSVLALGRSSFREQLRVAGLISGVQRQLAYLPARVAAMQTEDVVAGDGPLGTALALWGPVVGVHVTLRQRVASVQAHLNRTEQVMGRLQRGERALPAEHQVVRALLLDFSAEQRGVVGLHLVIEQGPQLLP